VFSIPKTGLFTGHSHGEKGGKLTFGKGTYHNVFGYDPKGLTPADLKRRAWEKLQEAKDLEFLRERQNEKNALFESTLHNMTDAVEGAHKELAQTLDDIEWRLRKKVGDDVVALKKSVRDIVQETQDKLAKQAKDGWEHIQNDLDAYKDTTQGSIRAEMRTVSEMYTDHRSWVRGVQTFLDSFAKRLETDKDKYAKDMEGKDKDVDKVVDDMKAQDAKLRQDEEAQEGVLRDKISKGTESLETELSAYIARLKVELHNIVEGGEDRLARKLGSVQQDYGDKLKADHEALEAWQKRADNIDQGLQKQMDALANSLTGTSGKEDDTYQKQTAALAALRGSLTELEGEMRAVYDKMLSETLPKMKEDLKGHQKVLEGRKAVGEGILRSIKDNLHELDWAVGAASSRSGHQLDFFISSLQTSLEDLRFRVARMRQQFGDQLMGK